VCECHSHDDAATDDANRWLKLLDLVHSKGVVKFSWDVVYGCSIEIGEPEGSHYISYYNGFEPTVNKTMDLIK
jgi:hypothetical protein